MVHACVEGREVHVSYIVLYRRWRTILRDNASWYPHPRSISFWNQYSVQANVIIYAICHTIVACFCIWLNDCSRTCIYPKNSSEPTSSCVDTGQTLSKYRFSLPVPDSLRWGGAFAWHKTWQTIRRSESDPLLWTRITSGVKRAVCRGSNVIASRW